MSETVHQKVKAGRVSLCMLIDKFIVERDKYDDREDLVRQLEQKDSSISSFLQRIRGALEQIESLEDEIATGEHVSPSIQDWSAENRAIAECKCPIYGTRQDPRLIMEVANVETRYLQVQDQPSPPKESLKQGDRYRPNYEKSPSVDSSGFRYTSPQRPQAMTRYRESRHATGHSRRDHVDRRSYNRRRSRSPESDRWRYRRPSPNHTQTGVSRPQHSHGSHRLTSFGTSHARARREVPPSADYGNPSRPVRKGKKWDPRDSGKR